MQAEGWESLQLGRRFYGIELKREYYEWRTTDMETEADKARAAVRAVYPRCRIGTTGVKWHIVSGRGTYELSAWCDTAEEAWLDAARRLDERKVTT